MSMEGKFDVTRLADRVEGLFAYEEDYEDWLVETFETLEVFESVSLIISD